MQGLKFSEVSKIKKIVTVGYVEYSIPEYYTQQYNLFAEEIALLFEGFQNAGNYTATFDGTEIAGCMYVYQLRGNKFIETKKLVLLK
jgi:hypothetical protein